jgi:hypothetical protein
VLRLQVKLVMNFYYIKNSNSPCDDYISFSDLKQKKVSLKCIKQKVKDNTIVHICGVCTFSINKGCYERVMECNHRIHSHCYDFLQKNKDHTFNSCPVCYK